MISWYAVQTVARSEHAAHVNLKRAGYRTFYPFQRIRVRKKIPNRQQYRIERRDEPYFTGYIFVGVLKDQSMRGIDDADGVIGLVRPAKDQDPVRVPDKVISALMEIGQGTGLMSEEDRTLLSAGFRGRPGQQFQFLGGSFGGLIGTIASVAKLDKTGSIKAWVDLFGGKREVVVDVKLVGEIA